MSIIHDALKKVQASLDRSYGRETKQPENAAPGAPVSQADHEAPGQQPQTQKPEIQTQQPAVQPISARTLFIAGNIFLVCLGIILVLVLKLLDSNKPKEIVITQNQPQTIQRQMAPIQSRQPMSGTTPAINIPRRQSIQSSQTAPRASTTRVSPAPAASRQGLFLSGTMLMDNQRVALINDDVYVVGDTVDEKEITAIELQEVTLKDAKGRISKLKVLNRR